MQKTGFYKKFALRMSQSGREGAMGSSEEGGVGFSSLPSFYNAKMDDNSKFCGIQFCGKVWWAMSGSL
jgi:hypothetical protein